MCSETSEAVGTTWEHAQLEFQKFLKIRITLPKYSSNFLIAEDFINRENMKTFVTLDPPQVLKKKPFKLIDAIASPMFSLLILYQKIIYICTTDKQCN